MSSSDHGPDSIIATWPELNSGPYFSSVWSRYIDLSSTAICRSVSSAATPASELNAGLVPSRILPPCCQSSGHRCQVVSSLPETEYAVPYVCVAGSVSFLAAARKSSQDHWSVGYARPAASNSFLL